MSQDLEIPPVRVLPEDVANKIAAGEVVERPASVVKELVENALDAGATRITVSLVAAGRRMIEVMDNGHGMSEQDAMLAIERHATSKVRTADDLDDIRTLGFRGEALASIAAVSRFKMITRRAKDDSGTRISIDGGVLRDVSETAAPVGTRVTANRLYFNTPVRAKFLKGVTTELSHVIDTVQRHALAHEGVAFQLSHNDRVLLDIPEKATLCERVALIWGLNFLKDMVEVQGERGGIRMHGLIGTPALTRAQRSHQFFFLNKRPIVNHSLQYGFSDAYRGLLTVGRHPVGIVMVNMHPRFVDVNIHPAKREVRFRDERAARDAARDIVREALASLEAPPGPAAPTPVLEPAPATEAVTKTEAAARTEAAPVPSQPALDPHGPVQTEMPGAAGFKDMAPSALYTPVGHMSHAPLQVFDTYLIVPKDDRLLIIDQHALHERLTFDALCADLEDRDYEAQQLAVPVLVDVPPSHVRLLESNIELFAKLGIVVEPFGGNTFQVTAVCHQYDEALIPDTVYRVLDELAQGDLFDKTEIVAGLLRLTVEACRGSVKAGDRLAREEREGLLDGFDRLRPPYTCPHGRPIVTELTQHQMEKSFRRRQ